MAAAASFWTILAAKAASKAEYYRALGCTVGYTLMIEEVKRFRELAEQAKVSYITNE